MTDTTNTTNTLPSDWAAYTPLLTDLVRKILAVAGGAGFTWALTVNADQVQMGVSAAMVLASALWGAYQKFSSIKALRRAAAAPAGTVAPKLPL